MELKRIKEYYIIEVLRLKNQKKDKNMDMTGITGMNLVLASSSPRRIEMFEEHGIKPTIIKPQCDETLPDSIGMEDAVMLLSLRKALEVENILRKAADSPEGTSDVPADLYEKAPVIVAADTIVYHGKIIGKPTDRADAEAILMELSGNVHYVVTGVSILRAGCTQRRTFAEVSEVHFKTYTAAELQDYLDTDEPYDKAGAYAIQGTFEKYIECVTGDYNNIVGFPWNRFTAELEIFSKL